MFSRLLIINIISIFLIITNAYAYLDPGTGSFILQAVLGFLAAISATAEVIFLVTKDKPLLGDS